MEKGSSGTLEALADNLAGHLLSTSSCPRSGTGEESRLEVTIRKPSAVPFAVPSITIERTIVGYTSRARSLPVKSAALNGDSSRPSSLQAESESMRTSSSASQRVFIALGSNLGDHVMNIKSAVRMLEDADCRIKGCGRMYESEPMYVEDQARFINSVIEVSTDTLIGS